MLQKHSNICRRTGNKPLVDAVMAAPRRCTACDRTLRPAKTDLGYLGHSFQVELPRCPDCGRVYISAQLARGKVAEVEALLEDK